MIILNIKGSIHRKEKNNRMKILFCIALFPIALISYAQDNQLAKKEKKAGWILLFDGKSLDGWRVAGDSVMYPDAGWSVEDNCLKVEWREGNRNRNIITQSEFADFEFSIEWKLAPAANSGIIYHWGDEFTEAPLCIGPEYQIIDDLGWPAPLSEDHFTGVDYEMHVELKNKKLNPVGEFNVSKIIFHKGHVEHWLNGKKIVEFDTWTPDWYARLGKSKWATSSCYGENKSGAFLLQNYRNCKLWFKNIKVRPL